MKKLYEKMQTNLLWVIVPLVGCYWMVNVLYHLLGKLNMFLPVVIFEIYSIVMFAAAFRWATSDEKLPEPWAMNVVLVSSFYSTFMYGLTIIGLLGKTTWLMNFRERPPTLLAYTAIALCLSLALYQKRRMKQGFRRL